MTHSEAALKKKRVVGALQNTWLTLQYDAEGGVGVNQSFTASQQEFSGRKNLQNALMMFFMRRVWHLKYSTLPCQKEKRKGECQSKRFGGVRFFQWSPWAFESDSSEVFFFLLFLLNAYLTFIKMQTLIAVVRKRPCPGDSGRSERERALVGPDHQTTFDAQNNANQGWCNQATIRWASLQH